MNILPVAFCPLGRPGAGKNLDCIVDDVPDIRVDEGVIEIAKRYGKSPSQVVLRWGVQRGYAVVPKSESLAH